MKIRWFVMAGAALVAVSGLVAADPALAGNKRHAKHHVAARHCADQPIEFSWGDFLFGSRPAPQWNGCSPPVYVNGEFVGQDPDPNVRSALRRNPDQGYKQTHW